MKDLRKDTSPLKCQMKARRTISSKQTPYLTTLEDLYL